MPELPEVHTIINDLKREGIIGKTIHAVHVKWNKTVAAPDVGSFIDLLIHKQIIGIDRRGKNIIFHLSENYDLIVHLRMTGRLEFISNSLPLSPYHRIVLDLNDKYQLRFYDTRKFGRWSLVPTSHTLFDKLGPEPLDPLFNLDFFTSQFTKRKKTIKALLLDQTFLAGLGNIYVDEALWLAKIHPLHPAHQLTKDQITALYYAILEVLKRGIAHQGTTLGTGQTNFYRLNGQKGTHQTVLNVFRRTYQPCPRCSCSIIRLVVAQRGTHICPICQVLPYH